MARVVSLEKILGIHHLHSLDSIRLKWEKIKDNIDDLVESFETIEPGLTAEQVRRCVESGNELPKKLRILWLMKLIDKHAKN